MYIYLFLFSKLCFRALLVPPFALQECPPASASHVLDQLQFRCFPVHTVLLCPLFFGVAHAHHLLESLARGTPLVQALLGTLLQFAYTYVFGAIATLLLLRTGNLASCVVAHVFCNFMGLPDLRFLSRQTAPRLFPFRWPLLLAHGLGLLLFWSALFPLTASLAPSAALLSHS